MKIVTFLFCLVLLVHHLGNAQDHQELSARQVLEIVRQYHPVIKLAEVNVLQAEAGILEARGGFDPTLGAYATRKVFKGTSYYDNISPELVIPTWFGMDIVAGTTNLTGSRLDPTETQGKASYAGINIPLIKGLVMDKRRAMLLQSKVFLNLTSADQRQMVNDLIRDAMQSYYDWVQSYENLLLVRSAIENNEKRFLFVKQSFLYGESPAIDTTEALTQLQSFQYSANDYELSFLKAGLELSAFLWRAENTPYTPPQSVKPVSDWDSSATDVNDIVLEDYLRTAQNEHPAIAQYRFKLQGLGINKKLKFQMLLPKLDFEYHFLNTGYNALSNLSKAPVFEDNFRYGLKFSVPLRLSEGRAAYKIARLKIIQTEQEQSLKIVSVLNKIKANFNSSLTYKKQVSLVEDALENYNKLVRAEELKFSNGESSLFLINSRELKALEFQEKWIAARVKYLQSLYDLDWAAGLLQ